MASPPAEAKGRSRPPNFKLTHYQAPRHPHRDQRTTLADTLRKRRKDHEARPMALHHHLHPGRHHHYRCGGRCVSLQMTPAAPLAAVLKTTPRGERNVVNRRVLPPRAPNRRPDN
jgi:hypothetical protein